MSRAHRPKAGPWIRFAVLIIYPLDSLLYKLHWRHLERIPAEGGVLIAVNHISQADTIATARMVWEAGRIPRFLIKSGLFSLPVLGGLLRGARQIPVHRTSSNAITSLQAAVDALRAGECVIIYPEGTITQDPDWWPMRAKTGVARLALTCPEIPVIPVGQWGAHETLGRNGRVRPFPRHRHVASVGEPVDLSAFRQRALDAETLREVTDTVMAAVTVELATIRPGQAPAEIYPWTPSPHLRRASARQQRHPGR